MFSLNQKTLTYRDNAACLAFKIYRNLIAIAFSQDFFKKIMDIAVRIFK